SEKSLGGSTQQEQRAQCASYDRSSSQQGQHVPPNIQVMPEGSTAECEPRPEREGIRRIRGNRRHAGKEQGWKCDEAAAAGDRVQRTSKHCGKKQENSVS